MHFTAIYCDSETIHKDFRTKGAANWFQSRSTEFFSNLPNLALGVVWFSGLGPNSV
jgi:hypothetical protein